jgi:hypothetical protein
MNSTEASFSVVGVNEFTSTHENVYIFYWLRTYVNADNRKYFLHDYSVRNYGSYELTGGIFAQRDRRRKPYCMLHSSTNTQVKNTEVFNGGEYN